MEHRLQVRRPVWLEAVLYRRDRPAIICRSRNVSGDGMFFELDGPAAGLEPGKGVRVGLTLDDGDADRCRRHRISGVIIHCSEEGIGVLFRHREAATQQALYALASSRKTTTWPTRGAARSG